LHQSIEAYAYVKGLDGKLLFEHQRNIRHHMPARDNILEDYNKGNNNNNLFTYSHSVYNRETMQTSGGGDCGGWLSQWLSHHVMLSKVNAAYLIILDVANVPNTLLGDRNITVDVY